MPINAAHNHVSVCVVGIAVRLTGNVTAADYYITIKLSNNTLNLHTHTYIYIYIYIYILI